MSEARKERKRSERASRVGALGFGGATALNTVAAVPTVALLGLTKGKESENKRFISGLQRRHKMKFGRKEIASNLESAYNPFGKGKHGDLHLRHDAPLPIVAHEAGHGIHLGKGSKLRKGLHMGSRVLGPYAGLAAAYQLAKSDDEKTRSWAPTALAAGTAPMLYQETRANYHAFKELKKVKGTKGALKALAYLAPAYATYAALPAGMYAGAKWALKSKEKGQEKRAFAAGFAKTARALD